MQSNKNLVASNVAKIYKGESNFDDIIIYLPLEYNDVNINDYIIQLNVINENNVGDVITLKNPILCKDKYKYEFPIPLRWTTTPGKLLFWLKFLKDDCVVGLTNQACSIVGNSAEIIDYMPENTLSLLDELSIKINSLPDAYIKDDYWIMFGKEG